VIGVAFGIGCFGECLLSHGLGVGGLFIEGSDYLSFDLLHLIFRENGPLEDISKGAEGSIKVLGQGLDRC